MEHQNKLKLESFILHLRKKTGLTQQELAQLAGVGKTVIFDLEHGKQSIQLDTLLKILKL
jgi:HTH-type transcriptional regulator/antitoxin HipB